MKWMKLTFYIENKIWWVKFIKQTFYIEKLNMISYKFYAMNIL